MKRISRTPTLSANYFFAAFLSILHEIIKAPILSASDPSCTETKSDPAISRTEIPGVTLPREIAC
jgi:hypothetical protein